MFQGPHPFPIDGESAPFPNDPPIPSGAVEHKFPTVVDGVEYMIYRNYIFPKFLPSGDRFLAGSNHGFTAVAAVEPGVGIRARRGALAVTLYSDENNTFYNILNFLNKEQLDVYITAAEGGDLTKKRTIGALSEEEKIEIGKRVVGADSIAERARVTNRVEVGGPAGGKRHRRRRNGKRTGKKHVVRRRRGTRKH